MGGWMDGKQKTYVLITEGKIGKLLIHLVTRLTRRLTGFDPWYCFFCQLGCLKRGIGYFEACEIWAMQVRLSMSNFTLASYQTHGDHLPPLYHLSSFHLFLLWTL